MFPRFGTFFKFEHIQNIDRCVYFQWIFSTESGRVGSYAMYRMLPFLCPFSVNNMGCFLCLIENSEAWQQAWCCWGMLATSSRKCPIKPLYCVFLYNARPWPDTASASQTMHTRSCLVRCRSAIVWQCWKCLHLKWRVSHGGRRVS